jgi:hypothetical protein
MFVPSNDISYIYLIFFSLLFEYTRMNTKSTTSWDDFFDNIFISDDEENRDEPEYTYADILAITYGAISGLIIFSKLPVFFS